MIFVLTANFFPSTHMQRHDRCFFFTNASACMCCDCGCRLAASPQVKERLRECLNLALEALPYFLNEAPPTSSSKATPTTESNRYNAELRALEEVASLDGFLGLTVSMAASHVRISLDQFLGYVNLDSRQVRGSKIQCIYCIAPNFRGA